MQAALRHPPPLVVDGVGAEYGGVRLGEATVHLPHGLIEVTAEEAQRAPLQIRDRLQIDPSPAPRPARPAAEVCAGARARCALASPPATAAAAAAAAAATTAAAAAAAAAPDEV